MLAGPPIRSSPWALAWVLVVMGCSERGRELANFEDDIGDTGGAPPDLPKLECLPRSVGFVGGCGPDEKCNYVVDPEFGPTGRCVPLLGEGRAGEPCTVTGESDSCESGAVCWAIDPQTQVGLCTNYCTAYLTCDDEAKVCLVGEDGVLALCLDPCIPTEPDACPPGWGCYDSPSGRWGCDRDYSGQGGAHGRPCECVNCCDPGLICLPAALVDRPECMLEGATGCCAAVCELPADGQTEPPICPTENESCQAYYADDVLFGYEQVGICRL